MGDREHPRTEPVDVAAEAVDVAHDLQHHLAGHVIGVREPLRTQVADDERCELVVELGPGRGVAEACSVEPSSEVPIAGVHARPASLCVTAPSPGYAR